MVVLYAIGADELLAGHAVARDGLRRVALAHEGLVDRYFLAGHLELFEHGDFVVLEAAHVLVGGVAVAAQEIVAGAAARYGHLFRRTASAGQIRHVGHVDDVCCYYVKRKGSNFFQADLRKERFRRYYLV